MMKWCYTDDFTYAHYDAVTALYEFDDFLFSPTADIILACRMMSVVFKDFEDDLKAWCKTIDDKPLITFEDYEEKIDLIKRVISMSGNGYKRMFVMVMKALRTSHPNFYFMDLPETSMHIMIARELTEFMMGNFEYTKFIVATHSPDLISYGCENYIDLMPENT